MVGGWGRHMKSIDSNFCNFKICYLAPSSRLMTNRIQASLWYIKSMKGRKKFCSSLQQHQHVKLSLKSFGSGIVSKRKWAWDPLSGKTGDWQKVELQEVSEGSRASVHSSIQHICFLITFGGRPCCILVWCTGVSSWAMWTPEHTGSVVVVHGLRCPGKHGILVPQPGIKPTSSAFEGDLLTTGPPVKTPTELIKYLLGSMLDGKYIEIYNI